MSPISVQQETILNLEYRPGPAGSQPLLYSLEQPLKESTVTIIQ